VLIFVCASDSPRVGLRVLRMMVHDASLVHDTSLVHDAPSARASSHMLCRVLEVPLIGYMGPKIRHAEVYPDFTRDYFRLMADLVVLGAMSGRLAVVPPVDCDSEWIARNPATASGVDQGPWRWDWREGEKPVRHNASCRVQAAVRGTAPCSVLPTHHSSCPAAASGIASVCDTGTAHSQVHGKMVA
jgi:hypothetical protein